MAKKFIVAQWVPTLGRILLFWILCMSMLVLGSLLTKSSNARLPEQIMLALAVELTFALNLAFARWEGLSLKEIGLVPDRNSFSRVITGFLIGLVLATLAAILTSAIGHVHLMRNPAPPLRGIFGYFLLYFLVACREELAFRAYPLRSIVHVLGSLKGQLIIALIFSLEHVMSGMSWKMALLGPGTGAILFGIATLRTKGIGLAIGLHAAWNFGQWFWGFKNEAGAFRAAVAEGYGSRAENEGLVIYLVIMWLTILAFYGYHRRAG